MFYVVTTCPNHYRLAENGLFWSGNVESPKGFKRLGWAKRAAVDASEKCPWVSDIVIIKVEDDEYLAPDGHVERMIDGVWQDTGWGRMVAMVVRSNLVASLFG